MPASSHASRALSTASLRVVRTAFSGDDDRFTTPITADDAFKVFAGGKDTSSKYDRDGNVIGYQVRDKAVDPDSIYKFRLKEEWVFDKESSRMFVRILGIAPVIPLKDPSTVEPKFLIENLTDELISDGIKACALMIAETNIIKLQIIIIFFII